MNAGRAEVVMRHIRRLVAGSGARALPDRELLQRFLAERDEDAFAGVVDRHGGMVLRVCRRVLQDGHAAEDAFQATFLILIRKARSIGKHESLGGWLYRVAYHLSLRMRACTTAVAEIGPRALPEYRTNPLALASTRELCGLLDEEVNRLPTRYREPFLLCHVEGQTRDQAARELGLSVRTLQRRLDKGRELLRCRLIRRGVTLSAALLAAGLAEAPAAVAVPALLSAMTVRAAASLAAGRSASLAGTTVQALAVAESIFKAGAGIRLAASLALLVGAVLAGTGFLAFQSRTAQPEKSPREQDRPVAAAAPADPLPPRALARLGTGRFRYAHTLTAIVYAPDGKSLAVAGHDGCIRLYDSAGKTLRIFQAGDRRDPDASSRWVHCVAFSPDGKWLASGDYFPDFGLDTLHIWETATGKEQFRLAAAHRGGVLAVAFSPDGKTLASAGEDGKVRLWDPATGVPGRALEAGAPTLWLAFSPDGKSLASADGSSVRLWDPSGGTLRKLLRGHDANVMGLAFSPDGKTLASVGEDKQLVLWDVGTGKPRRRLTRPHGLRAVAFSPDGKTIAAGGGPIVLWDVATGKELRLLQDGTGDATDIAFAPDGRTLAAMLTGGRHRTLAAILAGGGQRAIRLWDVKTGRERPETAAAHHGLVHFVRFAQNGETLFAAGLDQSLCRWAVGTGELLRQLNGRGELLLGNYTMLRQPVDVSLDGNTLAVGTQAGKVLFLDTASGKELLRFDAHKARVQSVALSPDGKWLATSGEDRVLCLWERGTGRLRRSHETFAPTHHLMFSADSKVLAGADEAGFVHLWDVAGGREWGCAHDGHPRPIRSLALSPDGRLVAAGTTDGTVHVWESATGTNVCRLDGHGGHVLALAFAHDGKTLAAGTWMKIILWEAATGRERSRFTDFEGGACAVAFAPGDRVLAAGAGDSSVLLWDVTGRARDGRLAKAALTDREFEEYTADLLSEDAGKAHAALWTLAVAPDRAVPWLKKQVKPIARVDEQRIRRLLGELDDDDFARREAAIRELEKLAEGAEPILRQTLNQTPSLEVRRTIERVLEPFAGSRPSPDGVRQLRMLEVLEQIGTPESRRLLESLAGGAPGVLLTREAKASLDRMAR